MESSVAFAGIGSPQLLTRGSANQDIFFIQTSIGASLLLKPLPYSLSLRFFDSTAPPRRSIASSAMRYRPNSPPLSLQQSEWF
jgi:hypothetical protein